MTFPGDVPAYGDAMKLELRISLVLVALLVAPSVAAESPLPVPVVPRESPLWNAVYAYSNGWESTAVNLARPLAATGDKDALFLMGLATESEQPARQSRGQAIELHYRKAAAAGHAEAGLRCLLVPLGSNVDHEKKGAREALEAAVARNETGAAGLLAEAWLRGFVDGAVSWEKARELWEAGAKSGDSFSMVRLGKLLDGTFGFPEKRNAAKAVEYYVEARRLGDDRALIPLGKLLLGADEGVRNEEEGRRCLMAAAGKGDFRAYVVLGDHEMGWKKNPEAAAEFYLKGAQGGDPQCMFHLAKGLLSKDESSAEGVRWLTAAAEAGNPLAAERLGARLAAGDPRAAARYFLLAANEGNAAAQSGIANLYLNGALGYRDPVSAVAWLTEAMKSGDGQMQYQLGTLHEQGIGCPVNYANAGVLYTMASNKGVAQAAGRIAFMAYEGLGVKSVSIPQAWAYASLAVERGDAASGDLLAVLEKKADEAGKAEGARILAGLRASPVKPVAGSGAVDKR
jgi:TPR repeat protein